MNWNNQKIKDLLQALLSLKNPTEAKRFLRDLMTESELEEFSNRWLAARLLDANVPYTTIQKRTGLSSTTVARISQWLKKGMGGYRLMLNRLSNHHHNSSAVGKGLS